MKERLGGEKDPGVRTRIHVLSLRHSRFHQSGGPD